MQSTLLAPEPQVDESPRTRNRTQLSGGAGPAALVAALAALGVALLTQATLIAVGLAVIALLLAVSAIAGARGHRGRFVAAGLAVAVSLMSMGALLLLGDEPVAGSLPAGEAVASEVADSPVALTVGSVTPDPTTKSTSVLVSVTNVSKRPVSTWASISATAENGKQYAAQGVGVRDLEPGATSTQQIQFGAVLPQGAVFVVKDVLL